VDKNLDLIYKAGQKYNLPIKVFKSMPKLEDSFWVNLIGKGYPSPTRWFRWCTDRLKIKPTSQYVLDQISKYGKVIVLLGTRRAESPSRARSLKRHDINGNKFKTHSDLPNAFVYTPIEDLTNDEVWIYLLQVPSPWNGNNKKLVTMYRNASGGDCPLVLDDSTSPCGNSRFGCWVCTVVDRDKSMEALVDSGQDWMLPLLEFRDWLSEIREYLKDKDGNPIVDDHGNKIYPYRESKGRMNDDRVGPFNEDARYEILKRLLEIEKQTGLEIITHQELSAIQLQWRFDGKFKHSVAKIYKSVKGDEVMDSFSTQKDQKKLEELKLLTQICNKHNVNPEHIRELMILEHKNASFLRRGTIFKDIQSKIERFVTEI
jgi:DNA sulfur modification protein DndC